MEIKRRRIIRDLLKDFRKRNVHDAELKSEIEWVKFKMSYKKNQKYENTRKTGLKK